MKILNVVGRIGMGGDTVAILNAIENLKRDNKIENWQIDFLTHDIGYNEDKVKELKEEGYKVFIASGDLRKLGPIKYYKELKKIMRENGPYDVVHVHTALQSAIPIYVAHKFKVGKIICHAHTNSIQREVGFVKKRILTPIFKKIIDIYSTDKIACSIDAGKFLYKKNAFRVINNAIDIDKYREVTQNDIEKVIKELEITKDTYVVGQIGRFSSMKNHKYTLNLAEKTKNDKNILYIFAGDGEQYESIKEEIKEKGLNVKCIGKRRDIHILTRIFDMMLLPSLEGEGFSIVLIEAQANMCPCLVSTCVPHAADLNLELLDYHDLNDVEYWLNKIQLKNKKNKWSDLAIKRIEERKMSSKEVSLEWYNLYTK